VEAFDGPAPDPLGSFGAAEALEGASAHRNALSLQQRAATISCSNSSELRLIVGSRRVAFIQREHSPDSKRLGVAQIVPNALRQPCRTCQRAFGHLGLTLFTVEFGPTRQHKRKQSRFSDYGRVPDRFIDRLECFAGGAA
jgi:hypothetical protein